MGHSRIEELEAKVRDLEATVEGLTDELVESKVRLRELENAIDEDLGFANPVSVESSSEESTPNESATEESPAEADKTQGPDDVDDAETESDIIIA